MLELFFQDFIRLFQENPIGQIFGFLGMLLFLYGFAQQDDKKIKKLFTIGTLMWMIHFYYMGLFTAALASMIGIIRLILSIKYRKNKYVFSGVAFLSSLLGFLTFSTFLHLLPIINNIIGSFNFFFLDKIKFRMLSFLGSLSRLFYWIHVGSLGGMLNEILTQFILIVVITRMAGHEGHIHHYKMLVHDVLHKNQDIDAGRFITIKDSKTLIQKEGYFHKIMHIFKKK